MTPQMKQHPYRGLFMKIHGQVDSIRDVIALYQTHIQLVVGFDTTTIIKNYDILQQQGLLPHFRFGAKYP